MKLICFADTHGDHERMEVPDGDVLICAGDFCWTGEVRDVEIFNDWLGMLPHPVKIVVVGNHDWPFEREPEKARAALKNAIYLENGGVEVLGARFWGSPVTPPFNGWAFNWNDERREELFAGMPDADVLITHGPARGVLDAVEIFFGRSGLHGQENAGCEFLSRAVERVRPAMHIFGHIHEEAGLTLAADVPRFNVSVMDGNHAVTRPAFIVEWRDG